MAKMTLLEMVQKCLSVMDGDDVNSIDETEESLQVVDNIEDTFHFLMSERDWPHLKGTRRLESVSDTSQPTTLRLPDDVSTIDEIRYETTETGDADRTFSEVKYEDPADFLDRVLARNTSNSNVSEYFLSSSTPIWVYNDRAPQYWTSFDDEYIIMDAWNSTGESTLNGSKSIVYCTTTPTFTRSDTFIADMPEKMFPLYLAECKRVCSINLRQTESPIDAKRSLAGRNRAKSHDGRARDAKKKASFGRK